MMDYATIATSLIALIVSVGGAVVLRMRGKAVTAIGIMAEILVDVSRLLSMLAEAQKDEKIEQFEITAMGECARKILGEVNDLKAVLGL